MNSPTADERKDARRPIASLISKSEKAQSKLTPGTWQHTMLRDNLTALRIALALINEQASNENNFEREELQKALDVLGSMIDRAAKAQTGFRPGTSQHTLLRNRLGALRIAEGLVTAALSRREA